MGEIRNFLKWRGGTSGGCHQVRCCGFDGRGFDTRGCFFLGFSAAGLVAAVDLGSGILGLAVFLVAVTFRLLGLLRDRLRIGIWYWSGSGLEDTPSSDYMIPPLAQVHLLGREPGPLSFRSGRVACGGALLDTLVRLLCKSRLRFFPLNTAPVVLRVVPPQSQD
jgi:hypothetical protein